MGYRFTDDKIEQEDQYLKRLSGLQRLYSAILITKLRRHQQNSMHPHGLENGWIWLSNFLNLNPLPEICATLLLEFISVCGSDMWQVYKKQFTKLLLVLHQGYMVKLDKVSTFKTVSLTCFQLIKYFFLQYFQNLCTTRSILEDQMHDSKF